MRLIIVLFVIFFFFLLNSKISFGQKQNTVEKLYQSFNFNQNEEKVKIIFDWLIQNIKYDVKKFSVTDESLSSMERL